MVRSVHEAKFLSRFLQLESSLSSAAQDRGSSIRCRISSCEVNAGAEWKELLRFLCHHLHRPADSPRTKNFPWSLFEGESHDRRGRERHFAITDFSNCFHHQGCFHIEIILLSTCVVVCLFLQVPSMTHFCHQNVILQNLSHKRLQLFTLRLVEFSLRNI